MSNYVLAYSGGADMPETEAEQAELMQAWGAWFESMGAAVVDGGAPTGASSSIAPDGSIAPSATLGLTGYSIIKADSMEAAQELAKGCPVLGGGGTVDILEALEM